MRGLFRRFGRRRRERDLEDEIQSHIEMAVEERVSRGEPRERAERAARREFGDVIRVKEATRRVWGGIWLDRLAQDVRFGVRSLLRDPGFTFAAVLVLGVGIGANALVFTLAHDLFLQDPPAVEHSDALVAVRWIGEDGSEAPWGYPDYAFVRDRAEELRGVLAYAPSSLAVAVGSDANASRARAWLVSSNFFEVLGAKMTRGRGFLPEADRRADGALVAVISHGFWQRFFGGDREIVGRNFTVNGRSFTVAGVASPEFRGVSPVETPPDLYVPFMSQGALVPGSESRLVRVEGRTYAWLRLVGRLDRGATVETAQASLDALHASWREEFSGWIESNGSGASRFVAAPDYRFDAQSAERVRRMLGFLAIVVAVVLLIGCVNLATLLFARASKRRGEIGLRSVLGAGRGRLLRQLLTESGVLAGVGGAVGLLLVWIAVGGVASLLPFSLDPSPDATVLLFTGVLTLGVTLAFGITPALRLSGLDVSTLMRRGRTVIGERRGARDLLVVGQLAACVVLVAGAALFVRSLHAAQSVELGFEEEKRLIASVQLANHGYDEAEARRFVQEAVGRVAALPGVDGAAAASRAPFRGGWRSTVRAPGTETGERGIRLAVTWAGSGYFETMGIPIVGGRPLNREDDVDEARSLVVSRAAADRLWPGEEAVGKTVLWQGSEWTVVGVSGDAVYGRIGEEPALQMYAPRAWDPLPVTTFLVKTAGPPASAAPALDAVFRELDPSVAVFGVQTLRELVDEQTESYRAMAILVSSFGLVALLLATVGLFGVQAYLVARRSREIGIRIALGARRRAVAAQILARGALMGAAGIGVGTGIALLLGRWTREMLFGVEPQDPLTLASVAGVLFTVFLAASYGPARRASRTDPMRVLRAE